MSWNVADSDRSLIMVLVFGLARMIQETDIKWERMGEKEKKLPLAFLTIWKVIYGFGLPNEQTFIVCSIIKSYIEKSIVYKKQPTISYLT